MSILDKAAATVADRRTRYGEPQLNHTCTARLWRAWLLRRHGVDIPLTARDVCWLNTLQKASRDADTPGEDNLIDTAGFAENASRCIDQEPTCGAPSVTDPLLKNANTTPAPDATASSRAAVKASSGTCPLCSAPDQPHHHCQGMEGL